MTEKGEEMRINVHNWIMLKNSIIMFYMMVRCYITYQMRIFLSMIIPIHISDSIVRMFHASGVTCGDDHGRTFRPRNIKNPEII